MQAKGLGMGLFQIVPYDDLPEWLDSSEDLESLTSSGGMGRVDCLARAYGHDYDYASDDMGACASVVKLTEGMRVAFTLAFWADLGDVMNSDPVDAYAYVRSDDCGFWDVRFASKAQCLDWLAMWRDNNEPHSDEDYADDGGTVLTDNARNWEGWEEFTSSYFACALWSSSDQMLKCGDCGSYYGPTVGSSLSGSPVKWCNCGRVCAYWDDEDLEDVNLDEVCDVSDIAAESLATMESECADFVFHHYNKLQRVGTMAQHGHDFWLTRNGHGVGFWDRGYGDIGEDLSETAKVYGECDLYVGDDGKVWCQ